MLKDFDLIRHSFPDCKGIDIYPIADVHLGAIEHAETEWEDFIKRVKDENAYLITVGDLLNNSTRGVKFANPFDEVMRPMEAKNKMTEYLAPLKDHILCVTTGNHEERTKKDSDQDLTYDICCRLGIEDRYRPNVCFMVVSIGERKAYDKVKADVSFTFCVTHGNFGGALTGGMVNKNERFGSIIEGMDILVTAHAHRGAVTKPSKIVIDPRNNMVSMKHYVAISCVSWMAYGGYAARKMLTPAKTCDPQKIRLCFDNHSHAKRLITTW